ncbi:DUF2332 domain-containing protein [Microcella alkaliphila]|uniref:DUF2332 domain-containing protein n=1 Tax=Microcella alkaliphila TaxID=279828 RepID=A0A0U5BBJ9_9MICO|nr:DUF2332 domain-containing protein [Microcella alkaliphila]BAU31615.1 uncharacterized protein MalAC0309_0747 [Microcella alkaliphila]
MNSLVSRWDRWARVEADGLSAQYAAWARAIAANDALINLIDALPAGKKQPNLVFAAARWHGAPSEADALVHWLSAHWAAVRDTVISRSTQTNEAARSAYLAVALARIPGPIALLELGAAAGTCLVPDYYRYVFDADGTTSELVPRRDAGYVTMTCELRGIDAPTSMPDIVWRHGIDLNPVSLDDRDEVAWLKTLVWPEHTERRERLDRALQTVAAARPSITRGDLRDDLTALVADAPDDATLVVVHSAVFAYLSPDDRMRAAASLRQLADHVISLEGRDVMSNVRVPPADHERAERLFVLALDGQALGLAAPHGGRLEALTE